MTDNDPLLDRASRRCPCKRQVPLDYSSKNRLQAELAFAQIDKLGEFTVLSVGHRSWKVSRHCIALHGVKAEEIDSYGFEEVTERKTDTQPVYGSAEWAETQGDDVPSLDQPGDERD